MESNDYLVAERTSCDLMNGTGEAATASPASDEVNRSLKRKWQGTLEKSNASVKPMAFLTGRDVNSARDYVRPENWQ